MLPQSRVPARWWRRAPRKYGMYSRKWLQSILLSSTGPQPCTVSVCRPLKPYWSKARLSSFIRWYVWPSMLTLTVTRWPCMCPFRLKPRPRPGYWWCPPIIFSPRPTVVLLSFPPRISFLVFTIWPGKEFLPGARARLFLPLMRPG